MLGFELIVVSFTFFFTFLAGFENSGVASPSTENMIGEFSAFFSSWFDADLSNFEGPGESERGLLGPAEATGVVSAEDRGEAYLSIVFDCFNFEAMSLERFFAAVRTAVFFFVSGFLTEPPDVDFPIEEVEVDGVFFLALRRKIGAILTTLFVGVVIVGSSLLEDEDETTEAAEEFFELALDGSSGLGRLSESAGFGTSGISSSSSITIGEFNSCCGFSGSFVLASLSSSSF